MARTPKYLVVDIETSGEPWNGKLLVLGVMDDLGNDLSEAGQVSNQLKKLLKDPTTPKVTHTKYDGRWLRLHGIPFEGPWHDTQVMAWVLNENQDLRLESVVRRYLGREMDKRIKRVAGVPMFRTDDGEMVQMEDAPMLQMLKYNLEDLEFTRQLYLKLRKKMDARMWTSYWEREEVPFTDVLLGMECAGVPVDLGEAEVLREELEVEVEQAGRNLQASAGLPEHFNLNSRDQLAAYLFGKVVEVKDSLPIEAPERNYLKWQAGKLKAEPKEQREWLPPKGFQVGTVGRDYVHGVWTVKGRGLARTPLTASCEDPEKDCGHKKASEHSPSTATPLLLVWHGGDPWVQQLIAWRKKVKVLTTYLRPLEERTHEGRLYGRFNQTGTKTGRLSSSGPNLQNVPAHGDLGPRVRGLFKGNLIVGDYSQLEPRLMAHFSQDPVLLDIYNNDRDIYLVTAEGIFGEAIEKEDPRRQVAKTYVLAMGYGAGVKKLRQILALNGFWYELGTVEDQFGKLVELYQTFFRWREAVIEHVKETGYVRTLAGRHRRLKRAFRDMRNWRAIGYGERQAVNAIIQGSAGDIVRRAMMRTQDAPLTLLLQVHDEMVWEYDPANFGMAPPDELVLNQLRAVCEEPADHFKLDVPLKFEPVVVNSWAEKGGTPVELPDEDEEDDAA